MPDTLDAAAIDALLSRPPEESGESFVAALKAASGGQDPAPAAEPTPTPAPVTPADPAPAAPAPAEPVPAQEPAPQAEPPPAATTEPVPAAPPEPTPAPTPEPVSVEVVEQSLKALDDQYEAVVQYVDETAKALKEKLNPETGIAEYSEDTHEAAAANLNARTEQDRSMQELANRAFDAVEEAYPELKDENSPAFIAVANFLKLNPEIASESPTKPARIAADMARQFREAEARRPKPPVSVQTPATPTVKPSPGPVPASGVLPSTPMASHSIAHQAPQGQPAQPDLVTQLRSVATQGADAFDALVDSVLGKAASTTRFS